MYCTRKKWNFVIFKRTKYLEERLVDGNSRKEKQKWSKNKRKKESTMMEKKEKKDKEKNA